MYLKNVTSGIIGPPLNGIAELLRPGGLFIVSIDRHSESGDQSFGVPLIEEKFKHFSQDQARRFTSAIPDPLTYGATSLRGLLHFVIRD